MDAAAPADSDHHRGEGMDAGHLSAGLGGKAAAELSQDCLPLATQVIRLGVVICQRTNRFFVFVV